MGGQNNGFPVYRHLPAALGWSGQDLEGRRKGDPQKMRTAARVRQKITLTLERIAGYFAVY